MSMTPRILIYGFGAMTSAMVEGWLASGLDPAMFTVFNPRVKPVPAGVNFTADIPGDIPAGPFDAIVLGFKPHMLSDIAPDMQRCVTSDTAVLSVLAGVELATLAAAYPKAGTVIRFMPNLACALGKSPNALAATEISDEQRHMVTDLARRLGSAVWIEDEAQFDLVTALAGSGPGFVYRFIGSLAEAAISLGLEPAQAQALALQMVDGAGSLAAQSELSPAELAAKVASPGGMTQKGLDVLDHEDAMTRLMTDVLRAARDRGLEMAREARENR
jgi:pyrroline-5-carboxylate reductase